MAKGPCDGCAGRVKQQVSTLVKTEEFVVNSALSFYEVCHSNLQKNPVPNECSHFVQTFHFTPKLPTRPKNRFMAWLYQIHVNYTALSTILVQRY